MTSSHSFDTYTRWNIWVLFIVSGIFIVVQFILIIVLARCHTSCWIFEYVKITFRDSIEKSQGSPDKFIFYGYEISLFHLFFLSTINSFVLLLTFMSFWASFLVDETFACDPQLDCFLRDPSSFVVLSSERVDNCTSYDGTNGTVVCFTFSFNLNNGFSSAVGFIGVAVVYCRLCIFLTIWLWKLPQRQNCCFCCSCFSCCFCSWCLVFLEIFMLIGFAIVTFVVKSRADPVETNESMLLNVSYSFCYLYVGPLTLLFVACCILRKGEMISTSSDTEQSSLIKNVKEFTERAPQFSKYS